MYERSNYFSYHFKRVLLAHIIVITFLFACWGVSVLLNKIKKKPPLTLPVNFVITSSKQTSKPVNEAKPVEVQPPVQEIQKTTPEPSTVPVKKTYKPVIKVNKKKVVRGEKKPEVVQNKITREMLEKELTTSTSSANYTLSDDQKNMVRIRNALYQSWQQPSKLDVGDAKVTLQIYLDASGNIISRKLMGTSGSKVLDDSVIAGASAVHSIPGLTKEFLKRNKKVTISFRVE